MIEEEIEKSVCYGCPEGLQGVSILVALIIGDLPGGHEPVSDAEARPVAIQYEEYSNNITGEFRVPGTQRTADQQ